jgi:hypothetical protein
MRWKRLPAGPRSLEEPDLVGSPELIQEQARWLKNHSPTFASAAQQWVALGPRKACRSFRGRAAPRFQLARALAMPTQDFVFLATAQPDSRECPRLSP